MDTFSCGAQGDDGRARGGRLRPLPAPRRAPPPAGRHAVRRRAADAGPGPGPHHRPGGHPPRRAVDGPGADDRRPSSSTSCRGLAAEGVTTVIVEQFAGVTAFVDRVAVMAQGRIRLAGPARRGRPTSSPRPTSGGTGVMRLPRAAAGAAGHGRRGAGARPGQRPGRRRRPQTVASGVRRLRGGSAIGTALHRVPRRPRAPPGRRAARGHPRARHRHAVERRAGVRPGQHVLPGHPHRRRSARSSRPAAGTRLPLPDYPMVVESPRVRGGQARRGPRRHHDHRRRPRPGHRGGRHRCVRRARRRRRPRRCAPRARSCWRPTRITATQHDRRSRASTSSASCPSARS